MCAISRGTVRSRRRCLLRRTAHRPWRMDLVHRISRLDVPHRRRSAAWHQPPARRTAHRLMHPQRLAPLRSDVQTISNALSHRRRESRRGQPRSERIEGWTVDYRSGTSVARRIAWTCVLRVQHFRSKDPRIRIPDNCRFNPIPPSSSGSCRNESAPRARARCALRFAGRETARSR